MNKMRFGLKKLNKAVEADVKLKSIFGLKPLAGECIIDFRLNPASQDIYMQGITLQLSITNTPSYIVAIRATDYTSAVPISGAIINAVNSFFGISDTATTDIDGWAYFYALQDGYYYDCTITPPDSMDKLSFGLMLFQENSHIDSPVIVPAEVTIKIDGEICGETIQWSIDYFEGALTKTIIYADNDKITIKIEGPTYSWAPETVTIRASASDQEAVGKIIVYSPL